MQWTHAHAEQERDAMFLHVTHGGSGFVAQGDLLAWLNMGPPGFSDRSASPIGLDLSGYQVAGHGYHASIAFPVSCSFALTDIEPKQFSTFTTHPGLPFEAIAFGRTDVNVICRYGPNVRPESGTPIIGDYEHPGKCRLLQSGINELADGSFDDPNVWDRNGDFLVVSNAATYTDATHAGDISQSVVNRPQTGRNNQLYRFTYDCVFGVGFDGVPVISAGFAAAAVALPTATGTHSVEFISGGNADGQIFEIDVPLSSAGTWTLDNVRLTQVGVNGDDAALQHQIVGYLIDICPTVSNELDDHQFVAGIPPWSRTGDFAVGGAQATYTDATHVGTLTQIATLRAARSTPNQIYRLTYDSTPGGAFDAGVVVAELTTAFGSSVIRPNADTAVTLPRTLGTHSVEFRAVDGAVTGDFTIDVSGTVGADTWVLDNLFLERIERSLPIIARCI